MRLLSANKSLRLDETTAGNKAYSMVPPRPCQLALLALLLLVPLPARGQQFPVEAGITVEGSGESKSVPDIVEINLKLASKAELSDDAVIKHRDAKKRALETFKSLKLENLEVEERDLGLKAAMNMQEMRMMMWGGSSPSQNKRTQVEVGSTLRARLTGVNKLPVEELMSSIGKMLDAAQDSGGTLGMSEADTMMMGYYGWGMPNTSLVKFIVSNVKEPREKAYENAVTDARNRAERLARLSGVKLGAVVAIDELKANANNRQFFYGPPETNDEEKHEKEEVVAETMSGGKIQVRLRVRFALLPGAAIDPKTSVSKNDPVAGEAKP
jgi:uncharacterized protein YggE